MFRYIGSEFINMVKSVVPTAKPASGGSEVVLRCPFCGDSDNKRHAHFYISVPQRQEDISMYHCKKCSSKGIFDEELLRRLGCQDNELLIDVIQHNAELMKMPKYKSLKTINVYPLKFNRYSNRVDNKYKLDYINNRIGSTFRIEDLPKVKIFLNLYDIINQNSLELYRDKRICDSLDRYFIGFLSYDNSFCGLRKVCDDSIQLYHSINKRYVNYSLVNKSNDGKNYYVIPTQFNIIDSTPVNIHITEGQFDILSVFYNLCGCNIYQNIYMACGGKSYSQALEFILEETGVINYIVHFYPDKDVTDYQFENSVLRRIRNLPVDIFIHRNMMPGEKDYGVPMDRIKDVYTVIKDV